MCVHGLHGDKGNLYTLKVSIFTFLRNIIILLHFYATHVIQVFVYLLSLQSNKLSYSAPSVYHYLYLNRKKIARTHTLFNSIYVQSACLSYTHMYHVHLHHVHFYSNDLLYYLSYTIFLNDNKIATCIYPKLKKKLTQEYCSTVQTRLSLRFQFQFFVVIVNLRQCCQDMVSI